MNQGLPVLAQEWRRSTFQAFGCLVVTLHCLTFILGILLAPDLFLSEEYQGSQCRLGGDQQQSTWYDGDASLGSCLPLGGEERVPLRGTVSSFRFPKDDGKVKNKSFFSYLCHWC